LAHLREHSDVVSARSGLLVEDFLRRHVLVH
jgi:hypothetical protein